MSAVSGVSEQTVELTPNYGIAIALVGIAIALSFWVIWAAAIVGVLGLFLTIQTALIRLRFTPTCLEVCRGTTLIREFPYSEWQNWQIFWSGVPILFYFREVKSIHFLPIIFDSKMLRTCLEQHYPKP
jgi:hypothetical protein